MTTHATYTIDLEAKTPKGRATKHFLSKEGKNYSHSKMKATSANRFYGTKATMTRVFNKMKKAGLLVSLVEKAVVTKSVKITAAPEESDAKNENFTINLLEQPATKFKSNKSKTQRPYTSYLVDGKCSRGSNTGKAEKGLTFTAGCLQDSPRRVFGSYEQMEKLYKALSKTQNVTLRQVTTEVIETVIETV